MINRKYLAMCHVIEQVAVMIYHNQWGHFHLPKTTICIFLNTTCILSIYSPRISPASWVASLPLCYGS